MPAPVSLQRVWRATVRPAPGPAAHPGRAAFEEQALKPGRLTAGWISAIVPTIGRTQSLTRLLESLAAQSRQPDEIIVADGSGTAEVEQLVAQPTWVASGLNVRRIAVQPPNAVRQRVAAIADAQGEYLLMLDDDVVLEPDCVAELMAALGSDPHVVGAVADYNTQSWPMPTRAWRFYMRYVLGMKPRSWEGRVVGPLLRFGYNPTPANTAPIEWLSTCNTLVRRSAYDAAGGFSDFFLHRCTMNEDVDLGLKMSRVGALVFCPRARLGHFHAPGGRVSPRDAAEDDLYNRYFVMRRTQGRSALSAFGSACLYFVIETISNLGGAALRRRSNGAGQRLTGRLRALGKIVARPGPGRAALKHYWSVVRDHPRPLRFLAAKALVATGACRLFTIEQRGYRLRFHPANLSSQLWIEPHGRDQALEFFRDYLKPGDRVVDVGANIGDTVLTAAVQVGPTGHVTGIEPHPRTFRFLQDNVALNGVHNVRLINSAVGAAPGTARFSDDRRDDMNRIGGGSLEVRVARLDDLVADWTTIALLKVDVEGYEKFVFEGAPELLKLARCVYFEVSSLHFPRFGYSTRDLLTLIEYSGFRLFRANDSRQLIPITTEYDTANFENLVALRDLDDFLRRTGWSLGASGS
ncbi:MAG: FkbM family methyltransferase [Vicinamibacterales bacterium]